jgi:ubiquinone/menaquinone biosynthesis C-methylase UbiE
MEDPKELARQLRKPEGEAGIEVAARLNSTNVHITLHTYACAQPKNNHRVLEIGFGNGKLMPLLLKAAPDLSVSGIDFSATMVEEAKQHLRDEIDRKKIEIKLGTASAIPYPDNTFDSVCTINTIYFWENPLRDAGEVLRVLKPGGKVFIGIRPKAEAEGMAFTKYGFTLYHPDEAVELLRKAGFLNAHVIEKKDPPVVFNNVERLLTSCCIIGTKP